MVGFPAFTDNHVRQPIVEGLIRGGWKVVRSVAEKIHAIAHARLKDGEAFRMVFWPQEHHARMSDGDFIRALEELSRMPDAFAYSIEYIKPRR